MEHLSAKTVGAVGAALVPAPPAASAPGIRTTRAPALIAIIMGQPSPAEPAERMTPDSAVYAASCRACGGSYDKPWRRCTA
ncbi:hypothetical protein ACFWNK_30810 [Streptomyces sp. NPDC058417]|uniref:hypothetical protein n=1 Tax=unclassified Streptomyces TaxID=2593676 RepID=UPI003648D3DD